MYTARVAPVFLILLLLGVSGPSGPEGPSLHPNSPTRSGSERTLTVAGDREGDEGAPVGFVVSAEAAPGEIVTYDGDFGDGTEGISKDRFKDHFDRAGVGSVITLP